MATIDQVLLEKETQDEFLKALMGSLMSATKISNSIPKGIDYQYHQSFPQTKQLTEGTVTLAHQLLNTVVSFTNKDKKKLDIIPLSDDVNDSYFYEQIAETIDALLDQAAVALKSHTGSETEKFLSTTKQSLYLDKERILQENVKDIPKPQLLFLTDIDNLRSTPFRPKLKTKYHKKQDYKFEQRLLVANEDVANPDLLNVYFPHPYEEELRTLEFPPWLLRPLSPDFQIPFPDPHRKCEYIDSEVGLAKMIAELKDEKLIAIDLEHHSFRSFLGLTCLMQISSLSKDYIIDTLALRLSLEQLGSIFADPDILKVLHGCEQDILWMQRDFGLYIVNGFDTYLAAKELQFPSFSLQHLVKYYCNVELDKKYQLSDWRQRPLTEEMLTYAKYDTHYLLFVFYSMLQDLWKLTIEESMPELSHSPNPEKIENVLQGTKKLCAQRYEKPSFDPLGYRNLFAYHHLPKHIPKLNELTSLQESCLSVLYNWRDERARADDESYDYIMSNAELLRLGIKIPQSIEQIDSCAPLSSYVVRNKLSLLKVLKELVNIDPTTFMQQLAVKKDNLEKHKANYIKQETQRFSTLFTMIPTVSTFLPDQGPQSKFEEPEKFFKTPPLTLDEVIHSTPIRNSI